MADILYKGFYQSLSAGDLDGAPDVRLFLFMSSFAFDEDSVNMADGVIDEFDGVGYARLDCASVTAAYVDADDEWQLNFTNGVGSEFGSVVAAGSGVITGLGALLHVDGTEANDVILASTTTGGFGVNAIGGPLNLTLPAAGLLFVRAA